MNRLLLKSFLLMTVMFTMLIVLAQARPHDDRVLRTMLLPDGCAAPCWQGIRPGETRLNVAVGILESIPGMEAIERPARFRGRLLASPVNVALMTHPGIRGRNPVVETVRLRLPDTMYGELQLALGTPDRVIAYATPEHGYTPFVAVYERYGLYVLVNMPACELATLWHTTRYVEVIIGNWLEYGSEYYLSSRELDVDQWVTELRGVARCDGQGFEWVETAAASGGELGAH